MRQLEPPQVNYLAACRKSTQSHASSESLPILYHDRNLAAAGFENIVSYILKHVAVVRNPDANLSRQQQMDRTASVFHSTFSWPHLTLSTVLWHFSNSLLPR